MIVEAVIETGFVIEAEVENENEDVDRRVATEMNEIVIVPIEDPLVGIEIVPTDVNETERIDMNVCLTLVKQNILLKILFYLFI